MSKKTNRVARITDCFELASGRSLAVMVGSESHVLPAPSNIEVRPGDLFLVEADQLTLLKKIGSAEDKSWTPDGDGLRWRTPNLEGKTRIEALWQRHQIRRAVRDYFEQEGFIEIDTPILVRGTTPDAAIRSFSLEDRYLITSSEYQIKRLQVGGFDRVFTLTQNFRHADGEGAYRNQEFTMLEWARSGQNLAAIEADAEQLVYLAHRALGGTGFISLNGHAVDLTPPYDRVSVAAAIRKATGVLDLELTLPSLTSALDASGLIVSDAARADIAFVFSLLMDHIQPTLGLNKPVFLNDWPAFETSSAKAKDDSNVVERSELFIAGVELSDGFPSLTSYDRQRSNFEFQMTRRRAAGLPEVQIDEMYLAALASGLPAGAGMALGFDRLAMLLTGRTTIREVLAFAWDEL